MLQLCNNQTGWLGPERRFSLNDYCCSVVFLSFKRCSRLEAWGIEEFLFDLSKDGYR
jgi:hypothetical protein